MVFCNQCKSEWLLFSVSSEAERETVNLEVVGSIPTRRVYTNTKTTILRGAGSVFIPQCQSPTAVDTFYASIHFINKMFLFQKLYNAPVINPDYLSDIPNECRWLSHLPCLCFRKCIMMRFIMLYDELLMSVLWHFRISVGGYHTCLSRREHGFESHIRKKTTHFTFALCYVCWKIAGSRSSWRSLFFCH